MSEPEIIIKKMGRPNTTGLIKDDNYFNNYYKKNSEQLIQCECGAVCNKFSILRHRKRNIHTKRMQIINP
jgi:hypothetical protein